MSHGGQHLAGHFLDDRVGIAVGHQARHRAPSGHAEPAGVVDDDQVDPAGLLAFGLMPVPAPPPMTGSPAATFFRSRSMIVARDSGIAFIPRFHGVLRRARDTTRPVPGRKRVIDIHRQSAERASGSGLDGRVQLLEECGVGLGIEERLPRRVQGGYAALGDQDREGGFRSIELAGDPAGEPAVLLGRRPHQSDLGVVGMEPAMAEGFGDGVDRPKVDHVEAPRLST